jgi:hypothetical protein
MQLDADELQSVIRPSVHSLWPPLASTPPLSPTPCATPRATRNPFPPRPQEIQPIESIYNRFMNREIPVPGKDFCDSASFAPGGGDGHL